MGLPSAAANGFIAVSLQQTRRSQELSPQQTSKTASAVIYYMPDGYSMAGRRLMGRQSAGASFLAGYARYAGERNLVCMAPDRKAAESFAESVRTSAQDGQSPVQGARWIPFDNPERIAETGCLYYPSPTISDQAWLRRRHDQRAWSICGITHTTASDTVMEAIGTFATAPLQSWDAVICTSIAVRDMVQSVLDNWQDYLGARFGFDGPPPARLQLPIIPLGINPRTFLRDAHARGDFRRDEGIEDDAVAALFLGRLSATAKAHPLPMFRGLQIAQERTGRKVHLILAGWFESDTERDQIERLAREICPDVRLHLVDGRDPVIRRKCWSAADFFTSLSDNIQETFGLTPVEAMAAGLPVVITDWNGYRDTLEDGVQGIAIPTLAPPPGSGDDIAARYRSTRYSYGGYIGRVAQFTYVDAAIVADAYTRLIENDDLRKQMGAAGRKRAVEKYDWSVIIPEYESLWRELAERRAKDSETAPPGNTRAADPLRDDPFRIFAGYPSATIGDDHVVERIGPDAELQKLIRFDINSAVAGLVPDAPGMRALLATLPQAGSKTTVGAMLEKSDAPRAAVLRAILWLSKLGIIRLSDAQM